MGVMSRTNWEVKRASEAEMTSFLSPLDWSGHLWGRGRSVRQQGCKREREEAGQDTWGRMGEDLACYVKELAFHVSYCVCLFLPTLSLLTV